MKRYLNTIVTVLLFVSVGFGVFLNVRQQNSIDKSKLPADIEDSTLFQRWDTNLRNKGLTIEADDFRLKESNEIYNTTWITVSSMEDPTKKIEFDATLSAHRNMKGVVFSPNNTIFVDYRNIDRDNIFSNQVRLYGLKEDKIIDARILDCSIRANCYFDRAYFLDNDVFVITEFSRNIDKKDTTTPICSIDQSCTYTVKLHIVDLIHNKRDVYESKPFDIILKTWIGYF